MDDQDLEKKLKDSVDTIEMRDFSLRWSSVNSKLNTMQEEQPVKILCKEPVLSSANNQQKTVNSRKNLIIALASVFFIVIVLAIIIPVTLYRNSDKGYNSVSYLYWNLVSEEEFFNAIEKTDMSLVDLSEYNIEAYWLSLTRDDDSVKGGGVEYFDEDTDIYVYLSFYDSSVLLEKCINDGKEYKVNNISIIYKTETKKEMFLTTAIAKGKNISYEMECISPEEDILNLFDKLFS